MLRADVLTFQTVGFILRVKQNLLAGLLSGRSRGVGITLPTSVQLPTLLRIVAGCAWGSQRLHKSFSPRTSPSNRCSAPITGDPNWLASYRAKKITRRAFSLYGSNIGYSTAAAFRLLRFQYKYPGTPITTIAVPQNACVGRVIIVFSVHAVPIST